MTLTRCEVGRCFSVDGLGIEVHTGLRRQGPVLIRGEVGRSEVARRGLDEDAQRLHVAVASGGVSGGSIHLVAPASPSRPPPRSAETAKGASFWYFEKKPLGESCV